MAAHDELKTAPRGYAKDHPRIALLRRKGLIAGAVVARRQVAAHGQGQGAGGGVVARVRGRSTRGWRPHVGPSELAPDERDVR